MRGLQYHGFSSRVEEPTGSVPDSPSNSLEADAVFELITFLFEALFELGAGFN
ncbi:MAG: hypothetical protein ABLQ96_11470 [Candidatus Acidiferrum sp.]